MFVYRSIRFLRDKGKMEEEQGDLSRWSRSRIRKFTHKIVLFHFLSFGVLLINRYDFLKADLIALKTFFIFMISSAVGIWIFLLIGRRLFKQGEQWILINIAFLTDIGFVMLYRLNADTAIKQLQWFAMGMVLLFFIPLTFRYVKRIDKFKWFYIGISIGLLLITALFGTEIYGAKNWLSIGGIQFQPSEFVKILFTFYLSTVFMQARYIEDLYIPALLIAVILIFLVLQRDLGSVLLYAMTLLVLMYISLNKKRFIFLFLGVGALGSFASYFVFSHIRRRIVAWWDPWRDVPNVGYQIAQGLFGIANGGWFGAGLTQGMPRKIPIVETDFIFAAICEEFGGLFGMGIIILFAIMVYKVLEISLQKTHPYFILLLTGSVSMIGLQMFIIVGGVIKLIPLTGITLPFISYGGSSMITNMIFMGLILYLTVHENPLEKEWE